MPEETELKTLVEEFEENLKEHRQERKEESGFLKMASLSTAIIAVIAAVATLESGSTVNEALSKKMMSQLQFPRLQINGLSIKPKALK